MIARNSSSAAVTATIVGLIAVAAGIFIQIAAGIDDFPRIPPGAVISIAVAALVAFVGRWWWIPITGAVWAVFLLIGAFVTSGSRDRITDRLSEPGEVGEFTGTLVMVLGIVIALVAGIVATVQNARSRDEHGQTITRNAA